MPSVSGLAPQAASASAAQPLVAAASAAQVPVKHMYSSSLAEADKALPRQEQTGEQAQYHSPGVQPCKCSTPALLCDALPSA